MAVSNSQTQPDWTGLRALFPMFAHVRYFATCSQGPLCTPVESSLAQFMDSWRVAGNPWESDWIPRVMSAAEKFGRLVCAPPGSVGITASVSAALGSILSALDFTQRRKVIASALDFPTLPDILLAYRQQGIIELEVLPAKEGEIPLDSFERALDARTGLVCMSSASYATGARLDIDTVIQMAHARGALALVDAYQTIGAIGLNVARSRPDFVVTGALKYLLGTPGVGLIYVAPELTERLQPRDIGWMAAANPFGVDFDRLQYAAGAARFQSGTFNIAGCYAADAALSLLLDVGIDAIEQRTLGLSRRFVAGLLELGARPVGPVESEKVGPMVAVPVDEGDAYALQERLRTEERVITAARGNALRFSFHFYHDESDVSAALDVVRRCL